MAGVICYSGESTLEGIKSSAEMKPEEYLRKIVKNGHMSIIEHNVFVFYISGISRSCSHQLVRKRIASFSQQSQRYVSAENFEYVVPNSVEKSIFADEYKELIQQNLSLYQKMTESGITKEDARYVLPNSTTTQLIVSMNAHSLVDFFVRRICTRSQWEIRKLAEKMLDEVKRVAPIIFKDLGAYCDFYGYCPEYDKSCGKSKTIEELKNNG
jgi:thymidylate synthase (FAD)